MYCKADPYYKELFQATTLKYYLYIMNNCWQANKRIIIFLFCKKQKKFVFYSTKNSFQLKDKLHKAKQFRGIKIFQSISCRSMWNPLPLTPLSLTKIIVTTSLGDSIVTSSSSPYKAEYENVQIN